MTVKTIRQFICREDNFAVLIHDSDTGETLSIDATDAEAIAQRLDAEGWKLSHILITHHHEDHVAGVDGLRARYGAQVIGNGADKARLPKLDREVEAGRDFTVMGETVQVIATPGHTTGQLAFYFPGLKAVFAADALFSLGCGRIFEGNAREMWPGIAKLRDLPGDTWLYCGHEYTQSNARFALSVEPSNAALVARAGQVSELRAKGLPTLPSLMRDECATNPFLRPQSPEIRAHYGLQKAEDWEVFGALRQGKDHFR